MLKKTFTILTAILFLSANIYAFGRQNIEIFDIDKNMVVKSIELTSEIQNEVKNYVKKISGMYVKVDALPDSGIIIRVPLNPPIMADNQWLSGYNINMVNEVFVIIPAQGKAFLLILDNEARPLFFNFEGDVGKLLEIIENS